MAFPSENLAVECPRCGAAVGAQCTILSGKKRGTVLHGRTGYARFHPMRDALAARHAMRAMVAQDQRDEKYPEHVRLRRLAPDSQKLGEFLDWLLSRWSLCYRDRPKYERIAESEETILALYFDVDLKKIEHEKRAMLAAEEV